MTKATKTEKSKVRRNEEKILRLPADFHWKLMEKISIDIENGFMLTPDDTDLKLFRLCVRNRDIEKYLCECDKHWGLKQLTSVTPIDVAEKSKILQDIRKKRLLTMFQKFDFPDSIIDKRKKALDTFQKYEERCRLYNTKDIFLKRNDVSSSCYDDVFTSKHITYIRKFICRTLGLSPNIDDFLCALRHGPGASTDKRGNLSIPIEKYTPPIGVSPYARLLFSRILASDERWCRSLEGFLLSSEGGNSLIDLTNFPVTSFLKEIDASVITTVPKSAKTDRTICIEPTANVYMQLAVDTIIRKNLKRLWNIDINTQSKNQHLALIGSLTNKLVTLDLSGASDSICMKWLEIFPEKWAKLLALLRIPKGILPDGETVNFQKLSAMGNGYTFAIETLIFSAIIYAVIRVRDEHWKDYIDEISVYGDDMIFPTKLYGEISYLLHRTGFLENLEKTFVNGPIRESCGHDYFSGYRIDRPTFKDFPKMAYELILIHNRLFEVGSAYGLNFEMTKCFLLKYLPLEERNFGPPCEDEVSWIFSNIPNKKPFFHTDHQRLYYRLKRKVIGHPIPKKCDIKFSYFIPMMYLSNFVPPLSSSLDLKGSAHRPTTDDFFFQKNVIVVRTSKALIPYEEWPSAIN